MNYLRTYDFFKIIGTLIKDSKDGIIDKAIQEIEPELLTMFKDECDATLEYLGSEQALREIMSLVADYRQVAINEAKRRLNKE